MNLNLLLLLPLRFDLLLRSGSQTGPLVVDLLLVLPVAKIMPRVDGEKSGLSVDKLNFVSNKKPRLLG